MPRTDEIAGLARTGCSTAPYPNQARRCSGREVTECDYWPGGIEPEGGAGIAPMKTVRAVTVLPDLTPMMCTCSPAFRVGRLLDVLPLTRYRVVEVSLKVVFPLDVFTTSVVVVAVIPVGGDRNTICESVSMPQAGEDFRVLQRATVAVLLLLQ